jgi:hypothetical protein
MNSPTPEQLEELIDLASKATSLDLFSPESQAYLLAVDPQRIAELCREVLRARGALELISRLDSPMGFAGAPSVAREALKGTP